MNLDFREIYWFSEIFIEKVKDLENEHLINIYKWVYHNNRDDFENNDLNRDEWLEILEKEIIYRKII
jgi:hypothetical protein